MPQIIRREKCQKVTLRHLRNHRISQLPGYVPQALLVHRALFETVSHFGALRHADATDWFLRAAEHGAMMEVFPDVLSIVAFMETIFQSRVGRVA